MKKVLITMAVLASMVAGAMVFSSFAAPKQKMSKECPSITIDEGWNKVGSYYGYNKEGKKSDWCFVVWEKAGMCNAYYWTYDSYVGGPYDPDKVPNGDTGALRKNSEGKWYAARYGENWFIDF